MTQNKLPHPNKLSQLVGGILKEVSVTKAASATANYTADDVISESCTAGSTTVAGTAWTFTEIARANGGSGYITKAEVICETASVALTHRLLLYLFNTTPTCMLSDNIANTAPLFADEATYIGKILFPALSREGTGASNTQATPSTVGELPLGFRCAAGADDLYGVLVTLDGVTGEKATDDYIIKLMAEQY